MGISLGSVQRRHRLLKVKYLVCRGMPTMDIVKLNICINKYTHNKTHKTNTGRNTSDIQTSERKISSTKRIISKIVVEPFHGKSKLDSHADTTVAAKNCAIIKYMDRSYGVAPFLEK